MQGMQGTKCACPHHKAIPVLIILFGLTFLLEGMGVITPEFAMMAWPMIIIAGGLMKLINGSGMCKCC